MLITVLQWWALRRDMIIMETITAIRRSLWAQRSIPIMRAVPTMRPTPTAHRAITTMYSKAWTLHRGRRILMHPSISWLPMAVRLLTSAWRWLMVFLMLTLFLMVKSATALSSSLRTVLPVGVATTATSQTPLSPRQGLQRTLMVQPSTP